MFRHSYADEGSNIYPLAKKQTGISAENCPTVMPRNQALCVDRRGCATAALDDRRRS